MELEPFIVSLNEKTNNEYKFLLKSAVLDRSADFCVIEILYKDGIMLDKAKKDEITKIAENILPKSFKYEFNFIKNFISEERIFEDVSEFLNHNFASVSYIIESVKSEGNKFDIVLKIDESSMEHIKQKNLKELIEKHLKSLYEDYEYKCVYSGDKVYSIDEVELLKQNYEEDEVDLFSGRKIEVSEVIALVGEELETFASYIKDYKSPSEDITFCGKIRDIKPIVIKRKSKPKNEEADGVVQSQNGEEVQSNENITKEIQEAAETLEEINDDAEKEMTGYQRKLYKFTLEDFTGDVSCVFFSNKENQSKLEKLEAGSEIIVRGALEEDKYSGGVSMRVKQIGYCKLPEKFEEFIVYRKEKPFYEFVEPEKVVMYAQDDLTSFMIEEKVPKHLEGKTFVCYDFETTGLHYAQGDKIIEIGAVKIENGKITEKFMTYVDPEKPIPAESSAISGIVDDDVKGAPIDSEALQDFYKFTRGAILTGYNILNFDNVFLRGQGKDCRLNFDNESEDVYHYAQKYVHGVKNYKLGTIAAKLGVTLDNAHRAVYDAMATAEVFIKLCKLMEKA
ncbi:MAG: 3'-5' exoribonuclease [Clostridia bacterium]|nr:3'-5' exoribonuclease [Clostridia bacterium]